MDEQVVTKRCPSCGEEKPWSEFHKSPRRSGGLDWQCRTCKHAKANAASQRRRDERRRIFHSKAMRAREQARAKWGKAGTYKCSVLGCEAQAEHLHHVDYDKPVDVVPLCSAHHNDEHMKLKFMQPPSETVAG